MVKMVKVVKLVKVGKGTANQRWDQVLVRSQERTH